MLIKRKHVPKQKSNLNWKRPQHHFISFLQLIYNQYYYFAITVDPFTELKNIINLVQVEGIWWHRTRAWKTKRALNPKLHMPPSTTVPFLAGLPSNSAGTATGISWAACFPITVLSWPCWGSTVHQDTVLYSRNLPPVKGERGRPSAGVRGLLN